MTLTQVDKEELKRSAGCYFWSFGKPDLGPSSLHPGWLAMDLLENFLALSETDLAAALATVSTTHAATWLWSKTVEMMKKKFSRKNPLWELILKKGNQNNKETSLISVGCTAVLKQIKQPLVWNTIRCEAYYLKVTTHDNKVTKLAVDK